MLQPGTRLGSYELLGLLGSGGMGEVYEARDTRLERRVAIKVLSSRSSASSGQRFEQEARAIAALNHPNICTLHDVGHADGTTYLVMERLEGETLQQRLRLGPLPISDCIDVGIALADALAFAHARNIIHRDVKPGNVFLTPHGPKFLDFGLAKVLPVASSSADTDLTRTYSGPLTDPGTAVGTVAYMSPEQLCGEVLDARSDLFSFGLVLYEMVAARPAFNGATTAMISAAILHEEPRPLRDLQPDVPPELNRIVDKALEKDRDIRTQSAAELRSDLKRMKRASSGPIASTVSTAPGVRPRVAGRDRSRMLWAGAVVLLVVAFASGSYFWNRAADVRPSTARANVELVPLTTTGKASRPALSPDGKYVVYVLKDGNEWSLWLRQTDTESNVRILAPEAGVLLLGATITPDGTFVDYVTSAPGAPRELWRIPLLGGAPRKLISGMQSLVSWSPDNRRMAFLRQVGTDTDLALITADADLGNERVLASRSGKATFISFFSLGVPVNGPAWSPDGRLLALAGAEAGPGGLRVVIVDAASGGERTLGFEAAGIHGLGWISSTEIVAVATELNEAPSAQVWRLSVTDGGRERMTTDISAYEGLSISADRRSVVTARMDTRLSLWVGDPAGRTGRDVEPALYWPTTAIINATVSWVGDRLLFTQFVRGRPSVVALAPNGTRATVVDDAYDGYGTPDGRSILFMRLGNDAVWRRDIDGRDSERLFDKGRVEDVSANNQDVAFVSVASGVQAPWIVSLADGKPHQLADMFAAGRSIAVSPDGRRVAFVTREPDGRRLIVCDLPSCTNMKKLRPSGPPRRFRWTPDARGIAYPDAATETNLWVQPLDGSADYQLTRFTDGRRVGDFSWSHDRSRLAVFRGTTTSDIVLIRGFDR